MFWAEDMSNLVQKVLDCESKVIYGNINDNWEIIIDHLIQGTNCLRWHLTVASCVSKMAKHTILDKIVQRATQLLGSASDFLPYLEKKLAKRKATCHAP